MMDLFLTNKQLLTSQYVKWWTGVVWITCDVLISCFDSHSDGTHSLQRIHWWASNVHECYISPNLFWWRNKLIYILDGLRLSKLSAIFVSHSSFRFTPLSHSALFFWADDSVLCGRDHGRSECAVVWTVCHRVHAGHAGDREGARSGESGGYELQ